MGRKRKTRGPKPTLPPAGPWHVSAWRLDPESGLPPVGKQLLGEQDRILRRARRKHAHKPRQGG